MLKKERKQIIGLRTSVILFPVASTAELGNRRHQGFREHLACGGLVLPLPSPNNKALREST